MEFLYTTTYTTNNSQPEFNLNSHVRVFNLATRFAIPVLQALAEERFRYALNNQVSSSGPNTYKLSHIVSERMLITNPTGYGPRSLL
jgi:hypothetical protein